MRCRGCGDCSSVWEMQPSSFGAAYHPESAPDAGDLGDGGVSRCSPRTGRCRRRTSARIGFEMRERLFWFELAMQALDRSQFATGLSLGEPYMPWLRPTSRPPGRNAGPAAGWRCGRRMAHGLRGAQSCPVPPLVWDGDHGSGAAVREARPCTRLLQVGPRAPPAPGWGSTPPFARGRALCGRSTPTAVILEHHPRVPAGRWRMGHIQLVWDRAN